jgi:hypothetical protein
MNVKEVYLVHLLSLLEDLKVSPPLPDSLAG